MQIFSCTYVYICLMNNETKSHASNVMFLSFFLVVPHIDSIVFFLPFIYTYTHIHIYTRN